MTTSFFNSRFSKIFTFVLLLCAGLVLRLYDITDLPLDFHPTRQLLSALKARGMYYETLTNIPAEQKTFAIQQWKVRAAIEPEVVERLAAFSYRFTGEQIWVARAYSSLFWIIGAVFIFLLARELTSIDGALASMAVYLFLPYSVFASRSFQPDPLMVMLIVIFWWAVYCWAKNPNAYKFAVLAGVFGGLAIFIKFVAVFFVIAGGLGALLGRMSLRDALKQPTVYVMAALGVLPGLTYMIYGVFVAGYLGQQFSGRFIPALFLSPLYYLGWVGMLNIVIGGGTLMLALLGLFFFTDEKKRFVTALWLGYFIFGLFFNYHISSHDYYSLPLIPIAALSLASLADFVLSKLTHFKTTVTLILMFGIFASLWGIRAEMKSVDYRPQAAMWSEIGRVTSSYNVIGLTQDYGSRLAYWGWKGITSWPTFGDLNYGSLRGSQSQFDAKFENLTAKKDLFIVTDFEEYNLQLLLKDKLSQYPVFAQGDEYIIYQLK
jgi:hypothetical protein